MQSLVTTSSCLKKRTAPTCYRLLHTTRCRMQKPRDYELRVGFAIATLQDDLPNFFQKGFSDHSIYSPNIILSDPHYTKLSIHGRTAYIGIAQMLRWSTSLYFDDISVEITKMRVLPNVPDIHDLDDQDLYFSSIRDAENDARASGIVKRLEVRWRLEGKKRSLIFQHETTRHIEGVFIYKFDHLGYIGEHRIQTIIPPPSRRTLLLHSLGVRFRSLWWDQGKRSPVLDPGF
ncbi:hypothetical protein RMATCC62417_18254 [Rhizopus microsporus]|nr:hypothetical protein RMATCC62417_18254 [Rhizopus microsporus]